MAKHKQPDNDFKVVVSIAMRPSLRDRVDQAALVEGLSRSAWICEILEKELNKQDKGAE